MSDLIGYAEAARLVGVEEATVRQWRSRRHLTPVAVDKGRPLFRPEDVQRANREALDCPGGRHRKGETQ